MNINIITEKQFKTLKDFESREKDLDFKDDYVLRESELKAEAIKRVKWRMKHKTLYKLGEDWINFFEITEEDLK